MSDALERFLKDVEEERVSLQGAAALTPDQILERYQGFTHEEAAAIVARSDADLIRVGAPFGAGIQSCKFTCGVSCGRTG